MTVLAVAGPFSSSPLWYLTRSTGITAFVFLTITTVFGIAATQRALASPTWPRFATQQLHRNVSLLAMVLLLVHIVTTLLDSYVNVGWLSIVLPFWSSYRTTGVALGTVAFDLLLLVVISSLLRLRMAATTWRVIHYTSYAAWPLALLHFLMTGTDASHGRWGIWLGIGGAVVVLTATWLRVRASEPPPSGGERQPRSTAMSASPIPPPPSWRPHHDREQRLLRPGDTRPQSLAEHLDRHGALPPMNAAAILDDVTDSGLLGRGGAGFPTGRKMRTVAAGAGRAVVVGNGCEGEPGSSKDVVLMVQSPHLVLDGLALAARAVGAREIHLVLHDGSPARSVLTDALADRKRHRVDATRVQVHALPARYVASEESALVQFLDGGPAKPMFTPPRPFERGVGGRPTLINNVETLAHLALIGQYGPGWYRSVGDVDEPGTMLLTVAGPRVETAVLEVRTGTAVDAALGAAGVRLDDCQAVLVGGYFGTWLPPATAHRLPLTHASMRAVGGALGAGIVMGDCPAPELRTHRDRPRRDLPRSAQRRPVRPLLQRVAGDRHGAATPSRTGPGTADGPAR